MKIVQTVIIAPIHEFRTGLIHAPGAQFGHPGSHRCFPALRKDPYHAS